MQRVSGRPAQAVFLAIVMIGILSGCRQAGGQAETPHVMIAAASSLERIAAVLVEEFNKVNPQGVPLRVEIVPDDEIRLSLEQDRVSAAFQWEEPPPGNWSALVGWTGILFAVHLDNPVEDLSSVQVQNIYLGRIGRWEEIGGPTGDIHFMAYDAEAGLEGMFEGIVLKGNRLDPNARIVPSSDAMSAAIGKDPRSIGFLPGFQQAAGIHILTIDTIAAEYPNVLSGKYPFRIPLYLAAKAEVPMEIMQFAGWMQSVAGQTILMQRQ